ncbi:Uncharacterised protein [Mycoplasmopsis citelli]|uniref:Lipoprotein n=1 Tax=Mycoplasmopsis citelli TaxID=171281 RepID=A0A449B359_9BACT|nr:hypothetical protein [Mycoplasmopsis citelli]VEU74974.1 Uncharacterised protein [Mycoplasmopsis citelli]
MKKKIAKILYSGMFLGAIGSLSAGCSTDKVTVKQIQNNNIGANHIDLSDSLLMLREVPSQIVKDLYDGGFLNKLTLVPSDKANSIDIQLILVKENPNQKLNELIKLIKENPLQEKYISSFQESLSKNLIKGFKIGEIRQGNVKNTIHEFYEKDTFFVKDNKGEWVKLDFAKNDQYLPIKLDSNGNLLIEYKLQEEDSQEAIVYERKVETNNDQEPLKKEIADALTNWVTSNVNLINQSNAFLAGLPLLLEAYKEKIDKLDPLLKDFVNSLAERFSIWGKEFSEFVDHSKNQTLTNKILSEKYFKTKELFTFFIQKSFELFEKVIIKNRSISDDQINNQIEKIKRVIQEFNKSKSEENISENVKKWIEFLNEYEKDHSKDQLLSNNETVSEQDEKIIKWLGFDLKKIKDLKATTKDILLLFSWLSNELFPNEEIS